MMLSGCKRGIARLRTVTSFRKPICRSFSYFGVAPEDRMEEKDLPLWIRDVNDVVEKYPMKSIVVFSVMQYAAFFALGGIYGFFFNFGPDLGVAYLIAKTTGKFRQPINIAGAAFVSKLFPMLSCIKVAPLLGVMPGDANKDPSTLKGLEKLNYYIAKPINKYGFAYYITARTLSWFTLLGTTLALKSGVDISGILDSIGISESLQEGGSALGAAAGTTIFLVPMYFKLLPYIVRRLPQSPDSNHKNSTNEKS